jgi:hypothetical protein
VALVMTDDEEKLIRETRGAVAVLRGVKLHLLDLGGDIAGNGLSKLFLTIAAAFAEAERDRISERRSGLWRHSYAEFPGSGHFAALSDWQRIALSTRLLLCQQRPPQAQCQNLN